MASHARKRLIRDFRKLQSDPPYGVSGAPVQNDIMRWHAVIFGPEDTPWEGGTFQLELRFSNDYPNKPPHVRFLSKLFHPNVYNDGNICLDILQTQWSPIYDISAILTSIQQCATESWKTVETQESSQPLQTAATDPLPAGAAEAPASEGATINESGGAPAVNNEMEGIEEGGGGEGAS
ncbi:hypothetical protein Emag_002981 [Eimeria magna]